MTDIKEQLNELVGSDNVTVHDSKNTECWIKGKLRGGFDTNLYNVDIFAPSSFCFHTDSVVSVGEDKLSGHPVITLRNY